jgi:hypothetical protein
MTWEGCTQDKVGITIGFQWNNNTATTVDMLSLDAPQVIAPTLPATCVCRYLHQIKCLHFFFCFDSFCKLLHFVFYLLLLF